MVIVPAGHVFNRLSVCRRGATASACDICTRFGQGRDTGGHHSRGFGKCIFTIGKYRQSGIGMDRNKCAGKPAESVLKPMEISAKLAKVSATSTKDAAEPAEALQRLLFLNF